MNKKITLSLDIEIDVDLDKNEEIVVESRFYCHQETLELIKRLSEQQKFEIYNEIDGINFSFSDY